LLALFTGGWIAGRLAGSPIEVDGVLHGFITWGLVALLSLWLFGTVAGSIVNGAIGAVGDGLSVLDEGVAAVVPEAIQAVEARDIRLATIRAEARNLAEDTENPSLQPDSLEEQGEEAGEIISQSAENIAVEPVSAGGEIEQAVDRLMNLNARTDADREDLVQLITANSDLSEEEARTTITNWEQVFDEVSINTEATINEVSETVTEAIAKAAGVVFMTLALGALAAMAGGYLGSPEMTVAEAVHVHEIAD
jgi:hypothetical protein